MTSITVSLWLAAQLAAPPADVGPAVTATPPPAAAPTSTAPPPTSPAPTPTSTAPPPAYGPPQPAPHGAAPPPAYGPQPAPYGAAPPPAWVAPPMVEEPPRGTWMRVGGGLAIGLGSLLGVSALICYATTDALGSDEIAARDALESTSLGLGLAGLVHVAAGIPLLVIGKRMKRRHDAWAQGRTAWRPRFAGGPRGPPLGVTLRF